MKCITNGNYIKKIAAIVCLVLWTGFIFRNSMQNGVESAVESGFFVRLLMDMVPEFIIRKAAHVFEFAVEGVLLVISFRFWLEGFYDKRAKKAGQNNVLTDETDRSGVMDFVLELKKVIIGAGISGAAVAVIDEVIQRFSQGRSSSIVDVGIDVAGVMIGIGLYLAIKKKSF